MDHVFTISGVTDVAVVRDKVWQAVGEIKSHNRTGFSQIVAALFKNKDMTYDDVLCTYVHYDTPKSKAASLAVSEKMRQ